MVINRVKDNIPLLELKKPTTINRKELRKYFRVDTRIKAKLYIINFDINNGELSMKKELYDAIIKDISGGGMRISTNAPIKENQAVEFDLSKSLGLQKEIFGKVVKIYNQKDYNNHTEAGIEFISVKENDRDKIIKYIFKRQIELKKISD
jgi:c-di-GMP-binding flagellar brake protein YcgR